MIAAVMSIMDSRIDDVLFLLCRDLEKAVEDLSELLESPIEPESIPTLRQKVTDKTVCSLSSFTHFSVIDVIVPSNLGLRAEAERDRPRGHGKRIPGRKMEVECHSGRVRRSREA